MSIETDAIQEAVSAELKPSNDILDPNFLFIRRWANRTEPVAQFPDSDNPNECLYRSDTVALSFCGGIVMSNFFQVVVSTFLLRLNLIFLFFREELSHTIILFIPFIRCPNDSPQMILITM